MSIKYATTATIRPTTTMRTKNTTIAIVPPERPPLESSSDDDTDAKYSAIDADATPAVARSALNAVLNELEELTEAAVKAEEFEAKPVDEIV